MTPLIRSNDRFPYTINQWLHLYRGYSLLGHPVTPLISYNDRFPYTVNQWLHLNWGFSLLGNPASFFSVWFWSSTTNLSNILMFSNVSLLSLRSKHNVCLCLVNVNTVLLVFVLSRQSRLDTLNIQGTRIIRVRNHISFASKFFLMFTYQHQLNETHRYAVLEQFFTS